MKHGHLLNIKLLRKIFFYFYIKKITKEYRGHEGKKDPCDDRVVLEQIIFPHIIVNYRPRRVLDIGRQEDQEFYNKIFYRREFWTIEKDSKFAEFGAKNHIIDNCTNLRKHFKDNYFDLVIMNGVFGWGLNEKQEIEKAFSAIYDVLDINGILILGWNDVEDLTPMPLENVQSLKKFKPLHFKPLKTSSYKCSTGEHTYNFYIKK